MIITHNDTDITKFTYLGQPLALFNLPALITLYHVAIIVYKVTDTSCWIVLITCIVHRQWRARLCGIAHGGHLGRNDDVFLHVCCVLDRRRH